MRAAPHVPAADIAAFDQVGHEQALLRQVSTAMLPAIDPEQRNAVDVGGWDAYWDDFFADGDVFYGHVLGFKGLERQVAVLAVNGFKDAERAREMLYVGLSRARTQLVVVGPRALLEQVGGDGVKQRLKAAQAWSP